MSEAKRYKLFQDVCYDDGAFVIPAGQVMVREADYNALRDERDRLRRLIEPLLKMTPERPNAITWENGVQIINYVQDILKAALTPARGRAE